MSQDQKIIQGIKNLLHSNCGFGIHLFDMLSIRQLESLEFAVGFNNPTKPEKSWEKIFTDIDKAIKFFVDERHNLQLGFDYEVEK